MKPFISVIIPTLNEEKFLPRLLTDLTQQRFRQFEVIVVDGGSKDKTIEKANQFLGKLPLIIVQHKKGNVSEQRNKGAQAAGGEYLLFVDADVQLSTQFLQILKRGLATKHPKFFTTYVKADSKNMADQIIATVINIGADLSVFVERQFAGGWNFGIKKQVFEKIKGFRTDVIHGEDSELSLRLYKNNYHLTVFKKPLLIYSLRRYRKEGRLTVLRKGAQAELHQMTNGPITKKIFDYHMGGEWYDKKKKIKPNFFEQAEVFLKKLEKMLEE